MDANKKFDHLNPQCLKESKILSNILLNHPLRLSIAGSASVPWIYMYQFWHTLQEDGLRYQLRFSFGTKELTMNVVDFGRIFQLPQATDNDHAGFVDAPTFDEELDQLLDGNENVDEHAFIDFIFNNQEDPDTWIEARSDKESPKAEINADMVHVNTNEEEEESAGDEFEFKRREKGNGEKLQELMVIRTCTSSTPSSSLLKPKIGCFKQCKSFIHQMGGCYGLLFGYLIKTFMPRKNFNELSEMFYQALTEMLPSMVNKEINKIAMTIVPIYVTKGLLLERQKNKDDVAAMIAEAIQKERQTLRAEVISQGNDAIANHIPSQVDSFLRNYMSENILHAHLTQIAQAVA
ncbi:hypothetical protein Tco_0717167 [Tanacetum coccineum]